MCIIVIRSNTVVVVVKVIDSAQRHPLWFQRARVRIMAVFEVFNSLIGQWIDTQGVLLFLLILLVVKYLNNLPPKNYPPGPLALPLLGNILNINIMDPVGSCKKVRSDKRTATVT